MKPLLGRGLTILAAAVLIAATSAPGAPVADAAMRGDWDGVRTLVGQGADVNLAQGDGMTALHWAAVHDRAELVTFLADADASLETGTRIGAHTPLHVASREGSSSALGALLAAGADVHALNTVGVTPLHLAALAGTTGAIAALLARGAQVDSREPEYGRTPLMLAAAAGRTGQLRFSSSGEPRSEPSRQRSTLSSAPPQMRWRGGLGTEPWTQSDGDRAIR